MPRVAPPAPPNTSKSCWTDQGPNREAAAAAGPEQTGLADRAPAAGSAAAHRQPTGSPLAGLGGRFGPRLQPAGAAKALGVGRGRGDEQGGRGAARAARWRLREARRAPRVAGCLPVLWPLCPADVGQPLLVHHESRRVGPAEDYGPVRMGVPHRTVIFRSASSAGFMVRGPRSLDSGHCELASHYCVAVVSRSTFICS
eukprot:COSAG06_NODE_94_length_24612_cov_12.885041_13_plen_199_part_00